MARIMQWCSRHDMLSQLLGASNQRLPCQASCAPGVQMRALQAMAVSRPPPRAIDSTAATVGFGPLSSNEQKLSLILHSPKNPC